MTDPIKREPKSPRKTFLCDLKLKIRNPIKAPINVNEYDNIDSLLTSEEYKSGSVKYKITETEIKNLSEIKPVDPSIPSIKFNELVITKKTNKEMIYDVNSEIS